MRSSRRPAAGGRDISDLLHPEGEFTAAGFVAEAVATDDVAGLERRGTVELGEVVEFGEAPRVAGRVGQAEHRLLLDGDRRARVVGAQATGGGGRSLAVGGAVGDVGLGEQSHGTCLGHGGNAEQRCEERGNDQETTHFYFVAS
jgi:hypothetical protein